MPKRPILNQIRETVGIEELDARDVADFADFLEKCTCIDPNKRITADKALTHPFLNILRNKQLAEYRR